jgi:hypothetical protein
MSMTRKEFLGRIVKGTALGAMAAGAVAACGGDDGDNGGGTDGACQVRATINGNHGHGLTVSQADVDAGVERTYDIEGTAGHTHSVTITAPQFATVAAGGNLTVVSTTGSAHTHMITVSCV